MGMRMIRLGLEGFKNMAVFWRGFFVLNFFFYRVCFIFARFANYTPGLLNTSIA